MTPAICCVGRWICLTGLLLSFVARASAQIPSESGDRVPYTMRYAGRVGARGKVGYDPYVAVTNGIPRKFLTQTTTDTLGSQSYSASFSSAIFEWVGTQYPAGDGTLAFSSTATWTVGQTASSRYRKLVYGSGVPPILLANTAWNGSTSGSGTDSGQSFSISAGSKPAMTADAIGLAGGLSATFTPTTSSAVQTIQYTVNGTGPATNGSLCVDSIVAIADIDTADATTLTYEISPNRTPASRTQVLSSEYTACLLRDTAIADAAALGTHVAWDKYVWQSYSSGNFNTNSGLIGTNALVQFSSDQYYCTAQDLLFYFSFQTELDVDYTARWEEVTTYPDGSTAGLSHVDVKFRGTGGFTNSPVYTLSAPSDAYCSNLTTKAISNFRILRDCGCEGGGCPPGTGIASSGSLEFDLSLGKTAFGLSAGKLSIHEETPSFSLATPSALKVSTSDDGRYVETITNGSGIFQVKSTELLAQMVVSNAYAYRIEIYSAAQTGALTNSHYEPTGSPQTVYYIRNPDTNAANNRLHIVEARSGHYITNEFTKTGQSWQLIKGNGLRTEVTTKYSTNSNARMEIREVRNPATSQLISKVSRKFQLYSWGEGLVEEIVDPDTASLKTTYQYDNSGRVTQVDHPDGYWESYSHDSLGRVTSIRTPRKNVISGTYREATFSYTNSYVSGSGDDYTLEPFTPRYAYDPVLAAHTYTVVKPGERRVSVGTTTGWNSAEKQVTITTLWTNGPWINRPITVTRPNGTLEIYDYQTNSAGTIRTNTVWVGAASSGTVTNGTRTVTALGLAGQVYSRKVTDVASGILTASEVYTYDDWNRPTLVTYLDATTVGTAFDCCGPTSVTNREGSVVTYEYDDLKRRTSEHVPLGASGIISTFTYFDADGNVVGSSRTGTNGVNVATYWAGYDLAGRLIGETNAVGEVTTRSYSTDTNGQYAVTTTFGTGTALAASRTELFYRDRMLQKVSGSAVHPVRFDYSSISGGLKTTDIPLLTNATDSAETVETSVDSWGHTTQVLRRHNGSNLTTASTFNEKDQLLSVTKTDNTKVLLTYTTRGEPEFTVIDLNQNGSVDLSGTDRITRSLAGVTTKGSTSVHREQNWVWPTDGVNSARLVSLVDRSVDGKTVWQESLGVSNRIDAYLAGSGVRYLTNTAPDGVRTVQQFLHGRVVVSTRLAPDGSQLGQTSYGYDSYGRASQITDARNGTTVSAFDDADRVVAVVTPAPGGSGTAQTNAFEFDARGRVWRTVLPDGTSTTNQYLATGELQKTSGSRTYPVEYSYDYRGRVQTLKTWQNAASGTGAALTTWSYDSNSGLLVNKQDNSSQGPTHAYATGTTAGAGRLSRRDWARGAYSTYTYNTAGQVSAITYNGSPTTPNITVAYDRLGNPSTIVQGGMTNTLSYNDASELLGEAFTGGDLNGLSTSYSYDALWRQTNLVVTSSGTSLFTNSYAYDQASRLASVRRGDKTAGYSFVTNSALLASVTFQDNGNTRLTSSRTYDFLNRLTAMNSTPGAGTALNYAYTYNSANQRTKVTQTDNSYWNYQYDSLGQVTSGKRYWSDTSAVAGEQFGYRFDDIGNRLTTESGGNEWGAGTRWSNATNSLLNQLTSRSIPSTFDVIGSATNTSTVTVNDQATTRKGTFYRAELTAANAIGPVFVGVTNLSVLNNGSSTNDLLRTETGNVFVPQVLEQFTYDVDGNLLTDGRWTYAWDGENRLVSLTGNTNVPTAARLKVELGYDVQGRRTSKKVSAWNGSSYVAQSTNRFVYDGWNLLGELDVPSGTLVRSYVWGTDLSGTTQGAGGVGGLLMTVIHTGTEAGTYFAAYDGNGNIVGLIRSSDGLARAEYEYGPFGEVIRASGPIAKTNPFRFSTKFQDDESDLLYYGYRFYNASTGRWLSRDPIEELDGPNVYVFGHNNSIGLVDTDGRAAWGWPIMPPPGYPPNFPNQPPPPVDPVNTESKKAFKCFLTGQSKSFVYGPMDPWTKRMQQHLHLDSVRLRIKYELSKHCAGKGGALSGVDNFNQQQLPAWDKGVWLANDLISWATDGSFGTDPGFRFGSFRLSWRARTPDCCCRTAVVLFHASDVVRLQSGSRNPITGNPIVPVDEPLGPGLPLQNVPVNWTWTETIGF